MIDIYFLEKCNAENLQDFAHSAINSQFLLDDGHEEVSVLGFGVEVADTRKRDRILFGSLDALEDYGLIAAQTSGFVDVAIRSPRGESCIVFGSQPLCALKS